MKRAAIIGGGISGMTTALLLRNKGYHVTLVECSNSLGPVVGGFHKGRNYYDTGFHYTGSIEKGEFTRRLFEHLGISEAITSIPYAAACFDRVYSNASDEVFEYPYGWERIVDRFSKRFPDDRPGIESYFSKAKTAYDHLGQDTLIPRSLEQTPSQSPDTHITLNDFLDRNIADPFLKYLLSVHSVLHGTSPKECSLHLHLKIMSTFYQSVSAIQGGGKALVSALASQLKAQNVRTKLGVRLTKFELSKQQSIDHGVLSNGEILSADVWVFSANPKLLTTLLPEQNCPRLMIKRLNGYKETSPAFVLYGTIKPECKLERHSNHICSMVPIATHDLDPSSSSLFFSPESRPNHNDDTFTCIIPTTWEPFIEWKDSIHGKRPASYRQSKDTFIEECKRCLETHLPQLKGNYQLSDTATPLTMKHYSGNPEGSLYGLRNRINDFILQPKTKIENLYLTGQSILAPGITGAMLSSMSSVATILDTDEYAQLFST